MGRHEGKVVFVPYALPGEEVEVEVVKERKDYIQARLLGVLYPSPDRAEPPCPYFGICGGCQWQHISYRAQLAFKESILWSQLKRLGGIPDPPVRQALGMEEPWHYRNHLQFHIAEEGALGFMAAGSRRVIPIEECHLPHPLMEDILASLNLEWPGLKCLSARVGANTGEGMLIFETWDDEPFELEVDIPVSCVFLLSDGRSATLIGNEHIHERLAGRIYRISAGSFFQVNTEQAEELVRQVAVCLAPEGEEVLLDAYCGVGVFGLSLSGQVGRVIGVEENPTALADARINAADVENVEFIEGKVEEMLPALEQHVDLAVIDPPRTGCAPEAFIKLAPKKIAYVSCDPATLARDVRVFCAAGYELLEVQPIDLFPQTYHIESVSLLVRKK